MRILAIETSCDETAAALLEDNFVLSSVVYSQVAEHAPFGGVVPEIASRAHVEKIHPVVTSALSQAGVGLNDIELVAATAGPGLIGALAVGFSYGRGLALSLGVPFFGVHHIEAHLFANYLTDGAVSLPLPVPPYLALIISGGHTELVDVAKEGEYRLWARTRDDAAGEAFDKTGKLLGLPYPAGPAIAQRAGQGEKKTLALPIGMRKSNEFSFSGLKTAVYMEVQKHSKEWIAENLPGICASVQEAIVDALLEKSLRALRALDRKKLLLAGGVACNSRLREKLDMLAKEHAFAWAAPPPRYCTDNAAMVGAAAWHNLKESGQEKSRESIFPTGAWYQNEHMSQKIPI